MPTGSAIKHDEGKIRFDLIPARPLEEIAKALTFGAQKYGDFNYRLGQGLAWRRLFRALIGHSWAWFRGEELDAESGLHHLAHAGATLLMLFDLVLSGIGEDNRIKG